MSNPPPPPPPLQAILERLQQIYTSEATQMKQRAARAKARIQQQQQQQDGTREEGARMSTEEDGGVRGEEEAKAAATSAGGASQEGPRKEGQQQQQQQQQHRPGYPADDDGTADAVSSGMVSTSEVCVGMSEAGSLEAAPAMASPFLSAAVMHNDQGAALETPPLLGLGSSVDTDAEVSDVTTHMPISLLDPRPSADGSAIISMTTMAAAVPPSELPSTSENDRTRCAARCGCFWG